MRGPEDRVPFRFTTSAVGSLDLERVQADPIWQRILEGMDVRPDALTEPVVMEHALRRYITYYLLQESLLAVNPAANGTATPYGVEVEIVPSKTTEG